MALSVLKCSGLPCEQSCCMCLCSPVSWPLVGAHLQHLTCTSALSSQGILYEDTYLQIGLQSRYDRAQGQVTLFLGNKHASAPLQQLSMTTAAPPQLAMSIAPPPPVLAPKQQLQVGCDTAYRLVFKIPGQQRQVQLLHSPLYQHWFHICKGSFSYLPSPAISHTGVRRCCCVASDV